MKKTLRGSLALAVTSGLLLAVSACAPTPEGSGVQTPNEQSAPAAEAPTFPKGGEKNITFESPIRTTQVLPAKWTGGDGWTQAGVNEVVALPNHIGYSWRNEASRQTGFKMYNDKGEIVADIGIPEEVTSGLLGFVLHDVVTVWQNDKMFTLFVQVGNDTNNDTIFVVTTFDENANQLHRKVLVTELDTAEMVTDEGSLSFNNFKVSGEDEVFNPETGELETAQVASAGSWEARINGVDIFRKDGAYGTDKWSLPYAGIEPLGKYISAFRADERGNKTGFCDIIDPKSGSVIDGNDGACATPWGSNLDYDDPTSPNGRFVLHKTKTTKDGENYTRELLFDPSGKSHDTSDDQINEVESVDADGNFYAWQLDTSGGETKRYAVTLNPDNGYTPEREESVTAIPLAISSNGIAAFNADGKSDDEGRINFVLPKK